MPKPRPLRPDEVSRTLVAKFEGKPGSPGLGDRLRQLHTKFGARSERAFLVWSMWTGRARGEGQVKVYREQEILPTPKVVDLSAISRNPFVVGMLPVGTVRLEEVSAALSEDVLRGRLEPQGEPIPEPLDFFYELRGDGRHGDDIRKRFRVTSCARRETNVSWTVTLERISEDPLRDGTSAAGVFPLARR